MRAVKALFTVICAVGVVSSIAADPGARDSVIIGRNVSEANSVDTLRAGLSTPIPIRIVNDETLDAIQIPLYFTTIGGGIIRADSIVWRDRASQSVTLPLRIFSWRSDSTSPDSLILALLMSAPPSFQFPPGNDVLGDLYVTGTAFGEGVIDTGFVLPTSHLVFLLTGAPTGSEQITPAFDPGRFIILEGDLPPVINLPDDSPVATVGASMSFEVSASSPQGYDCTLGILEIEGWDDPGVAPISQPSITSGNPATVNWSPTFAPDVGIWRLKIAACDSLGYCISREMMIQVVTSDDHNIGFDVSEVTDAEFAFALMHGDIDNDNDIEVISAGEPFLATTQNVSTYDVDSPMGLTRLSGFRDNLPKRALEKAFLGTDDYLDLILPGGLEQFGGDNLIVLENDGSGAFDKNVDADVILLTRSTALGNFNGDAYLDIVVGGPFGGMVLSGTADLDFVVASSLLSGDSIASVNAADFDGDGYDDIAVGTTASLIILINDGSGGFTELVSYPQNHVPLDVQVTNRGADFNNDDVFDLVTTAPAIDAGQSELYLYLGNGDGTFGQSIVRTMSGQPIGVVPADFDGDGNLDMIYSNVAQGTVGILYGSGFGTFPSERRYAVPNYDPRQIDCFDYDSDGDLDFVVSSFLDRVVASLFVFDNQTDPTGFSSTSWRISGLDNAGVSLNSSTGKVLNRVRNTMGSGEFYDRNLNQNGVLDEYMHVAVIEDGAYTIAVSPAPAATKSGDFSLEFDLNGNPYCLAKNQQVGTSALEFAVYPGAVSDISPRPGSFTYFLRPTFTWPGSGDFDFELATDPQFSIVLISETVSGSNFTPLSALSVVDTATYYWHVRSTGAQDYGNIYAVNLLSGSIEPGCGNIDNDLSGDVSIADLTYLVAYMFRSGPAPNVLGSANVNGIPGIDVSDLTALVSYMFKGGVPLICPDL